jgi:HEPN domain-containing protein
MKNIERIAKELFDKIRSRFETITIGDENAKSTDQNEQARFFNFDYVGRDGKNFGNITISIVDTESLKLYFGRSVINEMDQGQKRDWYEFLKQMRRFAKRNLLKFDARDISRSILRPRDLEQISKNDRPYRAKEVNLGESLMIGNDRTSYENHGPIKIIVRHLRPRDEFTTNSRKLGIKQIFLQNDQGERFRCPYNNLTIARALASHLINGGHFYDENYRSVCSAIENLIKIGNFVRRSRYENFQDPEILSVLDDAKQEYYRGRSLLHKLSVPKHYQSCMEELKTLNHGDEISTEDQEYVKEKLTKRVIHDRLSDALPQISAIYHRKRKEKEMINDTKKWLMDQTTIEGVASQLRSYMGSVKYESMNHMVEHVLENLTEYLKISDQQDLAEKCQSWRDEYSIMESPMKKALLASFAGRVINKARQQPKDKVRPLMDSGRDLIEELISEAWDDTVDIDKLKKIFDEPIEFGVDGLNAINKIDSIIQNDELNDLISKESQENPDDDARELIKYWIMDNYPDVYDDLDLKGQKPQEEPTPEEEPMTAPGSAAPTAPQGESPTGQLSPEMIEPAAAPQGESPTGQLSPEMIEPAAPAAPAAPANQQIQDLQRLSGIR